MTGPVSERQRAGHPEITPFQRSLHEFLSEVVEPLMSMEYRRRLRSMIDAHGRDQYNRGWLEGAKREQR